MSKVKLHQLLNELKLNLDQENINTADIQAALDTLEQHIENQEDTQETSLVDTANLLEAHFANKHPTAEALLRNIIETLHRMGI